MDSLPQEIIDEIIDNLPHSSLFHSSLIAKRWQKRSQQGAFQSIWFLSESRVKRWHMNTCKNPDRIPPYVQFASFYGFEEWSDTALFNNVLENFNSLNELRIYGIEVTNEMVERIQSGKFGESVTTLDWSPICSISTAISMILSFPNLQHLFIENNGHMSGHAPSAYHATSRREPLASLKLRGDVDGAARALVKSHFISRHLCLYLYAEISSTQQLLMLSSNIVGKLTLRDAAVTAKMVPPLVGQRLFPALTCLRMSVCSGGPSPRLMNILHHISSTPVLASIDIKCEQTDPLGLVPPIAWDEMDKWLARIAKSVAVEGGLVLTLRRWLPAESDLEGYFPEFRESGCEVKTDQNGWDD